MSRRKVIDRLQGLIDCFHETEEGADEGWVRDPLDAAIKLLKKDQTDIRNYKKQLTTKSEECERLRGTLASIELRLQEIELIYCDADGDPVENPPHDVKVMLVAVGKIKEIIARQAREDGSD